jgi:hypothetical protein
VTQNCKKKDNPKMIHKNIKPVALLVLILVLVSGSCSLRNDSLFFSNCSCNQMDLRKGLIIADSLNHFQLTVPDSSWKPLHYTTSETNSITVGDTSRGYVETFSVLESSYQGIWDIDKEQEDVLRQFNVILSGDILFKGQECRWNLILYKDTIPETYALFLTYLDTINKLSYTISLTVESSLEYEKRICELESILASFNITK